MKFAIIGLGQFGRQLAEELAHEDHEVVAVDIDERIIEDIKDTVDYAVVADASDARVLKQLGLEEVDVVVVAIGEDFATSLLVTGHLQELKVKRLLCRSLNPTHDKILKLMKVDEIVQAEEMAARQLAKRLGIRGVARHFTLGEDFAIVELGVPANLIGKTVAESELRGRYGLNLVTIKRGGAEDTPAKQEGHPMGVPTPDTQFQAGDSLIVFGKEEGVQKLVQTERS